MESYWLFYCDRQGRWQWELRQAVTHVVLAVSEVRFPTEDECRADAMLHGFDPSTHSVTRIRSRSEGRPKRPIAPRPPLGRSLRGSSKCHVLLVDDEADFRESAALLLRLEGFEVSAAAEGEEALAMISRGAEPNILLLDQRMPGLSGTETLQALRQNGHEVPAVLVSAVMDVQELAIRHRFDAGIRKPFNHPELSDLVRSVLRARGLHGS